MLACARKDPKGRVAGVCEKNINVRLGIHSDIIIVCSRLLFDITAVKTRLSFVHLRFLTLEIARLTHEYFLFVFRGVVYQSKDLF